MSKADGSSPLARGLPKYDALSEFRVRIIPARAGFTIARFRSSVRARDHPRSRGVYQCPSSGSYTRARIIPARAGFT